LGFESADHPLEAWLERGLELCADHGGEPSERGSSSDSSAQDTWRNAFLQAPYLRDTLVAGGVLSETFESAITWDRLEEFVNDVCRSAESAVREACGAGTVTCRLTHAYADGAAPYFTVLAPARRGSELEQWAEVKEAASEAIITGGGTITHHHAVGRDHRRWYDRQRPEPFAQALRAAKTALDPAWTLNPGVLVDPR
jgi:alkyldihydroxyacetonephosphate synthase